MISNLIKPRLETLKRRTPVMREACIILENAYSIAESFYFIYRTFRTNQTGTRMRGRIGEQEQDLLRAILLFSASGLDAVVKRLIKDTYILILKKDEKTYLDSNGKKGGGIYLQFERFVEEKIKKKEFVEKESQRELVNLNSKFLAKILATSDTHAYLVKSMENDLTENSLQSFQQLAKVGGALEIGQELINKKNDLEKAFEARNYIVHEMDIDLSQATRRRRNRNQAEMIGHANLIFKTARLFIQSVEAKL